MKVARARRQRIDVGTRVKVSEGRRIPPEWLSLVDGPDPSVRGLVREFIPGDRTSQNEMAVVSLDRPLPVELPNGVRVVGSVLVLSLRYCGREWRSREVVGVGIRPDRPTIPTVASAPWGEYIESNAVVTVLPPQEKPCR